MKLSMHNPAHNRLKIFDKSGQQLGRIETFDTESCEARRTVTKNGKAVVENDQVKMETLILEGAYAATSPDGKRL